MTKLLESKRLPSTGSLIGGSEWLNFRAIVGGNCGVNARIN